MKKLYHVELTDDERAQLRALSVRRDIRPASRRKAEALLQVDAGKIDREIAQALGVTWNTIQRYRIRFARAGSLAAYIEAGELPLALSVEMYNAGTADRRRRRIQALARRAKPLPPASAPRRTKPDNKARPGKRAAASKGTVTGNRSVYLAARIARDRPDVLERMKQGEFTSMRAAAWEAGIRSAWREGPLDPLPVPTSDPDGV